MALQEAIKRLQKLEEERRYWLGGWGSSNANRLAREGLEDINHILRWPTAYGMKQHSPARVCGLNILFAAFQRVSLAIMAKQYPGVRQNTLRQRKHRALILVRVLASRGLRNWIDKI